jgi:hypothetical protein
MKMEATMRHGGAIFPLAGLGALTMAVLVGEASSGSGLGSVLREAAPS